MAVPALLLHLISHVAREYGGRSLCSAGYPDLLVTAAQLDGIVGAGASQRVPVRPDSKAIADWHGAGAWLPAVYDSGAVFAELGYTLEVIDIVAARGNEIIVDLNRPLPADFTRRYDVVLDTGTCEHCFHIGQAAMNLAQLVTAGGVIVQALPLSSYNHGFYNVNPTWVFDFYPANGFEIVHFQGVTDIVHNPRVFELPTHDRFGGIPDDSILLTVARRTSLKAPVVPTQHKYAVNPKLGNA